MITEDLTGARYPFHYMILKKIPGRDLHFELKDMTQSQMTTLAESIVSFQQIVAQLPLGMGYGWVPIHDKGEFNRWTEIIHRDVHNGLRNVQGVLSTIEIGRIEQKMACLRPYFDDVRPICFLDDVTTKNVILQSGILQGVVDLDCVCYGDPLYMISLTKTAIVADGLESRMFYIEALAHAWELTDEQRKIVDVYALVHAMIFLGYFAHNESGYQRTLSFVKACIASLS